MHDRQELNNIYIPLLKKSESVIDAVKTQFNKVLFGFYNNHFHKNEIGEYIADCFPIPVISIENLCDIEFDLDTINITSKLTKQNTVNLDYIKLNGLNFEIYGVLDYLKDYYTETSVLNTSLTEIGKSNETEFFFTFYFDNNTDDKTLLDFLTFIKDEQFFY